MIGQGGHRWLVLPLATCSGVAAAEATRSTSVAPVHPTPMPSSAADVRPLLRLGSASAPSLGPMPRAQTRHRLGLDAWA